MIKHSTDLAKYLTKNLRCENNGCKLVNRYIKMGGEITCIAKN